MTVSVHPPQGRARALVTPVCSFSAEKTHFIPQKKEKDDSELSRFQGPVAS